MPRLRTLKAEFFTHELLCELSPLHRLLYEGLWCYADRAGRLEDRPRYLKTVVLPYDACDVDSMLTDLHSKGFVVRYQAEGKRCIAIPGFLRHQKPHPKEAPSILPPAPHAGAQVIETTTAAEKSGRAAEKNGEQGKSLVEQGKDHDEPGGLGDLGLGGICLGEIRREEAPPVGELLDGISSEFKTQRGEEFGWSYNEENALRGLLSLTHGDANKILAYWERALRRTVFPLCSSLPELKRHWNHYAANEPERKAQAPPRYDSNQGVMGSRVELPVRCAFPDCEVQALSCFETSLCLAHEKAVNEALTRKGLDFAPWKERVAQVGKWLEAKRSATQEAQHV